MVPIQLGAELANAHDNSRKAIQFPAQGRRCFKLYQRQMD